MIKDAQLEINSAVVDARRVFQNAHDYGTLVYMKRLRHCQAWVYCFADDNGEQFYLLRSYGTFVAGIFQDGTKYDWLRYVFCYTATSAQHIAKFFKDYAPNGGYMWRYYPV